MNWELDKSPRVNPMNPPVNAAMKSVMIMLTYVFLRSWGVYRKYMRRNGKSGLRTFRAKTMNGMYSVG